MPDPLPNPFSFYNCRLCSTPGNVHLQPVRHTPSETRCDGDCVCLVDDGEEVHFVRGIVSSSAAEDATYQSQYKINDRIVSLDAYTTKLKTFGILVKARNFLVFQVRIMCDSAEPAVPYPVMEAQYQFTTHLQFFRPQRRLSKVVCIALSTDRIRYPCQQSFISVLAGNLRNLFTL